MLTVSNGGRMSRLWLAGMGNGAVSLGLRHSYIEIDNIRQSLQKDPNATVDAFNQILIQRKVGLVLSYALNAATDLPIDREWPGAHRNFFEVRGIPQCFFWADHPQWVADKQALRPDLQQVFRSGNQFHFVKSDVHAYELNRVLGWPNCHALPCGADPEALKPMPEIEQEYDLVAVYGNDQVLPDWLLPFLEQENPEPVEINQRVAEQVILKLNALWEKEANPALRPELAEWSRRAVELKLANPSLGLARHINRLTEEFPKTMWWLTAMYPVYFKAAAILYDFRSWQRHFYLAYLSKYFRVGLFGGKWSHVGKESEQAENRNWVDFVRIPQVIARGKVALDIVAGWDEEGLTAKTFELAACGVAMIHNECVGLEKAFVPGKEIEIFQSPRQARDQMQRLLDEPDRRKNMAYLCRQRLLGEHTWAHRVQQMLKLARIPIDCFR